MKVRRSLKIGKIERPTRKKKCTIASRYKPAHEAKLAREYFFSHPIKIKKQKNPPPFKKLASS
jgi:hypothetical protein